MPGFLDFVERATTGPILSESDFQLKVLIPNVRKVVREFGLRYDGENPVPADDSFADRLFGAAVEFAARTGIYSDDTNRLIQVQRDEILAAVSEFRGSGSFGEGRDRRSFPAREPGDSRPPWCHVGTGIVASSEEIAMAQVQGYGGISRASSISIPAFGQVRGMPVIGGSPLEIYATAGSVQAGRKALWKAGRPGLPIMNLISSATTSMATIAGTHPSFGLRPSDGWLIDFIAEMKVNFETLNRLAFIQATGGNIGSTALPILGGYAGGPAGTALVMAAYYLLGMLMFRGTYHLTGPVHFRHGCSTTRDSLWVFAVVGRAMSRNTRYPSIGLAYAAAGPCTRMYFYESAAVNLCCVPSGYAGIQTVHPARAVMVDGVTPVEAQFNVELAQAAAGLEAGPANEVVNRLLEHYEDRIDEAPQGLRYRECHDLETGRPSDEYLRLVGEVTEELVRMGVDL
jgi:methylamine--corrinoid protein Co-methyltransferase